jgi:hypothetical protein
LISAHGKVKEYFMPLEELQARFGPEAGKRYGETRDEALKPDPKRINWNWSKLTLPKYAELKQQGFSDNEIVYHLPWLNSEQLKRLKKGWGIH